MLRQVYDYLRAIARFGLSLACICPSAAPVEVEHPESLLQAVDPEREPLLGHPIVTSPPAWALLLRRPENGCRPQTEASSSSAAHRFPWEVLLAISQYSQEKTLYQLCLVSFGMLGSAGPLLYRNVLVASDRRLYHLFIEPSSIESSSRLRPFIGLHLVRSIQIDYRGMHPRELDVRLPAWVWDLPDRRIPHSLSVVQATYDRPRPMHHGLRQLDQQLQGIIKPTRRLTSHTDYKPVVDYMDDSVPKVSSKDDEQDTVGFGFFASERVGPRKVVARVSGIKLEDAVDVSSDLFDSPPRPARSATLTHLTVDLCRVRTDHRTETLALGQLRRLTYMCMENQTLWTSPPSLQVSFYVSSKLVALIVEEAIASSSWDSRRERCRVVKV